MLSYKDLVREYIKLVSVIEEDGRWRRMIRCGEMPKENLKLQQAVCCIKDPSWVCLSVKALLSRLAGCFVYFC